MGSTLKRKLLEKEKYNRPSVADYQLELAKDILTCLPPATPYIVHSELYSVLRVPYKRIKE